jgi:hypothetical protein
MAKVAVKKCFGDRLRLHCGFLQREREDKQRNSGTTIELWSVQNNAKQQ